MLTRIHGCPRSRWAQPSISIPINPPSLTTTFSTPLVSKSGLLVFPTAAAYLMPSNPLQITWEGGYYFRLPTFISQQRAQDNPISLPCLMAIQERRGLFLDPLCIIPCSQHGPR